MASFTEQVLKIFTDAFIWIMVNSKSMDIDGGSPGQLRRESRKNTSTNWLDINAVTTGGAGLLTGFFGGPWSIAAETADIAVLLRSISRGCFGVGYIISDQVDFEEDMIYIMALWTGCASIIPVPSGIFESGRQYSPDIAYELIGALPAGKIAVKLLLYGGASNPQLLKIGAKLCVYSISMLLKKGTPKFVVKIAGKAAEKVLPKAVGKLGGKWIPVIGGVLSAGINLWVYQQITHHALKYYRAMTKEGNFLVMNKSLFEAVQIRDYEKQLSETKRDLKEAMMQIQRQEKLTLERERLSNYKAKQRERTIKIIIFAFVIIVSLSLLIWLLFALFF